MDEFTVRVGVDLNLETWKRGSRDPRQWKTIHEITRRPDFGYACTSFSDGEITRYKGPVVVTWYDVYGKLRASKVAWNGRILAERCA